MRTAIIIGGGPAGLTAAYMLLKHTDIHPILLEADTQVGGISKTVHHGGNRMDIGGHRFFSKNDDIMQLWQTLLPLQGAPALDDELLGRKKQLSPNGPDPKNEDRVMLLRTRVSRIFYLGKFFDYPISLKPETLMNLGLVRTFTAGCGYVRSLLSKKEEQSLRDFMINRFGSPLYKMFFEDYTEKVWGRNPRDISADWGAQRIKGLSLKKALLSMLRRPASGTGIAQKELETSLIEQFLYPKYGPGQLWETMAEEIRRMGGEILLNEEVTAIQAQDGRIQAVRTQSGREFSGEWVFSSMPVRDLIKAMGDVPPQPVREIALSLPYRDFITVGLLVKKLRLQNKTAHKTLGGIVPDCWIYIQERGVKLGRLQIFNNWSPYMVREPESTVWVGLEYFCNEGDAMWNMNDADFIRFATDELASIGIIDGADVLDSVRLNIKKAYPAYFGSYAQFSQVREYLGGFENLLCIGRNGQHRYNNMDHSMLTAMEAVQAVKRGGIGRERVWEVNTEEDYHEEK